MTRDDSDVREPPREYGDAPDPPHHPRARTLGRYTPDGLLKTEDALGRAHYRTPDGRPVCGRLKKEKNREIENEACLAPALASGACRAHGGNAGAPVQHGRYSQVLRRWRADFERAAQDKALTDIHPELAMMDVLLEQLVARAEEFDTPSWREELRRTHAALSDAIKKKRHAQVGALMKQLGDLIDRGATADQVARDLMVELDRRANRAHKMNELELRREEKITASELAAVMGGFLQVLERNLEAQVYFRLLPMLKRVTEGYEVPGVGEPPSASTMS